jgi:hypothetical protein
VRQGRYAGSSDTSPKKKKGACDAAAQVVIGVLQRTQIRRTLLTRDSEPSRIARIEFKKQKNFMDIEWQHKASVRDMTTAGASACILLFRTFDYGTGPGTTRARARADGKEIEIEYKRG